MKYKPTSSCVTSAENSADKTVINDNGHNVAQHSILIEQYLPLIKKIQMRAAQADKLEVLDLACGSGRNGRYLVKNGFNVCFADIKSDTLKLVSRQVSQDITNSANQKNKDQIALIEPTFWAVDFEQEGEYPLQGKRFSGITVFRYLHRPILEQIKSAVIPGGFVIYETFNVDNVAFGRPKNPKFLLNKGELLNLFSGWEIVHHFEGIVSADGGVSKQAISQIVAIKPDL